MVSATIAFVIVAATGVLHVADMRVESHKHYEDEDKCDRIHEKLALEDVLREERLRSARKQKQPDDRLSRGEEVIKEKAPKLEKLQHQEQRRDADKDRPHAADSVVVPMADSASSPPSK